MVCFSNEEIEMLSQSLEAYVDYEIFPELFTYVKEDMKSDEKDRRYTICKCQECNKFFIVERTEIINKHIDCFRDDIPMERDWKNSLGYNR